MSVHIHITLADLFKMAATTATATTATATTAASTADGVAAAAASDVAAEARVAQEAAHVEETKKLQKIIEEHKVEFMNLKWNSFSDLAKAHRDFEYKTKELNDKLNEALYNQEQRAKEDAETIRDLRMSLDDAVDAEQYAKKAEADARKQIESLTDKLRDAEEHTGELLHNLELSETSKSRATERAQRAEETVRQQKEELERMNMRSEEVAREKKAAYNDLVVKFDSSVTFYEKKLEEAQEIRERLENELKDTEEDLKSALQGARTTGQKVRETTLRAMKLEHNFMRLCAAIDTVLSSADTVYHTKIWDKYEASKSQQ